MRNNPGRENGNERRARYGQERCALAFELGRAKGELSLAASRQSVTDADLLNARAEVARLRDELAKLQPKEETPCEPS